jgi:hypothetical protein
MFLGYPGDGRECHRCRGKVASITVEMSPKELTRLKALATLRGVSVAEFARAALSEYASIEKPNAIRPA